MQDANMCIKLRALELVNVCLLRGEHFLVGNVLEHYGKGVQELASLLNVSLMIKLHTTYHFSSISVKMDVKAIQEWLLKGSVLGIYQL
jgi:hypothetical protein